MEPLDIGYEETSPEGPADSGPSHGARRPAVAGHDPLSGFPALACRLIEAGEQTGSLDTLCHVLADFYTRADKDRRAFLEALAYPAFLLACLLLLMTGAVFFIIPVFVDMMAQMKRDDP